MVDSISWHLQANNSCTVATLSTNYFVELGVWNLLGGTEMVKTVPMVKTLQDAHGGKEARWQFAHLSFRASSFLGGSWAADAKKVLTSPEFHSSRQGSLVQHPSFFPS